MPRYLVPILSRFDVTVYRNLNGVIDKAQVPATEFEATVQIYRQGATANLPEPTPVPPQGGADIAVYNTGCIEAGDSVMVDASASTLLVIAVDIAASTITVENDTFAFINVQRYSRLTPTVPALVFDDPVGTSPLSQPLTPSPSANGRVTAYVKDFRFDYVVTVPGDPRPVRLFVDAVGSYVMRG